MCIRDSLQVAHPPIAPDVIGHRHDRAVRLLSAGDIAALVVMMARYVPGAIADRLDAAGEIVRETRLISVRVHAAFEAPLGVVVIPRRAYSAPVEKTVSY